MNRPFGRPAPYALLLVSAAALVVSDPAGASIQFSQPAYSFLESAGTVTVRVTRTDDPNVAQNVTIQSTPGMATRPGDYNHGAHFDVPWPAGATFIDFSITLVGDALVEGNHSFDLFLSAGGLTGAPSTVTVTILDDDLGNAPILVTNTADSGLGSLRNAISAANGNPGLDAIHFNIAGGGPHTIAVPAALDPIMEAVIIDGTTQPGFAGTPRIVLAGPGGGGVIGLDVRASGCTIRGLAIHSFSQGIRLFLNGNSVIAGNYIGTDAGGMTDLGNNSGIEVANSSNNRIGGTTAADRNLISGQGSNAINLSQGSGNQILGNWIGSDATGEAPLANGSGITVAASHQTTIGGAAGAAGNVIGASGQGVTVASSNDTVIQGNRIGISPGGVPLPNNFGIDINSSLDPVIGGVGAGNIVSHNNLGMLLNNGVENAAVLGNTFTHNNEGILLNTIQTTDITIGGIAAGEGNLIAFNANKGIWNNGLRVTVRGNSIHSNGQLGHDLEGDAITRNDAGDTDTGANGRQNWPNLFSTGPAFPEGGLAPGGGGTRVQGRLYSMPSTTYTLDFYGNPVCSPRPQEFVEGETWLGTFDVTTDGSGLAVFDQVIPVDTPVGARIVATATDPDGNTSEFSQRTVFSAFPRSGSPAGGASVNLDGAQFEPGSTVTVGAQPSGNVTFNSATSLTAVMPALTPGSINGITVATPSGISGTLPYGWIANFTDAETSIYLSFIVRLVANGLTAGCGGANFCVDDPVTRAQMAVFLLRGLEGLCFVPPPETGTVFDDVPLGSFAARWIEELSTRSVTGGCGGNNYCPNSPVTREQMAVFLLVTLEGPLYMPPPCTTPSFNDVPCSSGFARWINELVLRNITAGCGGGNYCPLDAVTRGQMAVFLSVTFDLPS